MLYKRLSPILSAVTAFVVPVITWAQTTTIPNATTNVCQSGVNDFTDFLVYLVQCLIGGLVNRLLIALAIIVFFVGVVRYIYKAGRGDTDYDKNIQKFLGYSILAFFVMLSLWGIIFTLGATFGIGQGGVAPIPTLPTGP